MLVYQRVSYHIYVFHRLYGTSLDFHSSAAPLQPRALQVPTITTWQASFGPSAGVVHTCLLSVRTKEQRLVHVNVLIVHITQLLGIYPLVI